MSSVTDVAISLPGGQLMVQDAGPPDGLPVLVYSGSPGSRHLSPAALRLAGRRDLRLIGVDPPGYGGSAAQPGRRIGSSAADAKADRIPGVEAHFPADDDHGTIEASHASQAYDWLIAVAG